MPFKSIIFLLALLAHFAVTETVAEEADMDGLSADDLERAQAILDDLVADYVNDPMAIDAEFGIKLKDAFWTISVENTQEANPRGRLTDHALGPHKVMIERKAPEAPTWYFEIADMNVLQLIASGDVNAGTAAMQSFGSDQVGVEIRQMDGFEMTTGDSADMYLTLSHFFTKGVPEITRFGPEQSLETHGAQATALHMMKGFRVVYFTIPPQAVVNEDPRLEFGQMPNLFIVTKGKGRAFLADDEIEIRAGMSIFVPQYVRHQIINDSDEPIEGVLVLYGDNSDFAFGTSYPAFQEDLNDFYRTYPFKKN